MTVSLLMPVGFTDQRRADIMHWVLGRWMLLFPEWQICLGTDDSDPYNRSRAWNNAFQEADGEILVITDADTITTKENVLEAIALVERSIRARNPMWVIAHGTYYSLTEEYTDSLMEWSPDCAIAHAPGHDQFNWKMINKSEAGVIVMPREAWEDVEGYDERFRGWGWEDNAFAERLRQKWGNAQRTEGDVLHLWHDPGANFGQPYIKHNENLYQRTVNAL